MTKKFKNGKIFVAMRYNGKLYSEEFSTSEEVNDWIVRIAGDCNE